MRLIEGLRFRIEYIFVRASGGLLRLLPVDAAAAVVGCLVGWVGPWTSLHARALRNLAVAFPEWSEAERKRVAAAMWRNTGRTIAETILLDLIVSDPSRLEIKGRETLERHLREPGANIFIQLHMGNWEISGIACGLCGGKLAGVYRPLRNPWLDRYLRRTRSPLYPGGLLYKGTKPGAPANDSAAVAAINLLRAGGHLGVVCDQVDEGCAFTVPFFGHEAKFTPAPAVFARRVGARIWILRCVRRSDKSRFLIEIKELPIDRTVDRRACLHSTTAAMARQFEHWIRDAPEQWMWWQRRSISGQGPTSGMVSSRDHD
jgi:Kdo2-lipid IVA lauroyltransferase/acyltransferase